MTKWCGRGDSNPHGHKAQRILSPLRLPIPPRPLKTSSIYAAGENDARKKQAASAIAKAALSKQFFPLYGDGLRAFFIFLVFFVLTRP